LGEIKVWERTEPVPPTSTTPPVPLTPAEASV
jgi:hypothetical protein